MNKRLRVMICTMISVALLTGCQLAKEETALGQEKDKLIGVYMTTEYVDTFDLEGYMEDNLEDIVKGKETVVGAEDTANYQDRIYATILEDVEENGMNGGSVTHVSYRFDDLEGIGYYSPVCYETEEGKHYVSIESDPGICDGHNYINSTDGEEQIRLEGTIYLCPDEEDNVGIYCNPVYQCPDGSVYLVSGYGMSFSGSVEGGSLSHKVEDKVTVNENGEEKTYVNSIEIKVETVYEPTKIQVLQMDLAGNKLDSAEYIPGKLPGEVKPLADTEYFIIETHKQDAAGESIVTRKMVGKEETFFQTLYVGERNVCEQTWTDIKWD